MYSIGIISDGIIVQLQDTIDASRTPKLTLYSLTDIQLVSGDNATLSVLDTNLWELDCSECEDRTELVLENGQGSKTIIVYNAIPRLDYLENWLKMQQLSHLVPVLKKLGWHKLKEAALKAKQISDLQGTEQALSMLLRLLEVDENVELYRYWRRKIEQVDDIAFDDMHATDLADNGYSLTGKLKLVYHQDKLNPWSDELVDTLHTMELSLADLVTCIEQCLPATLSISDYELVKIGLGMISYDTMTSQNSLQSSETDIDVAVSLPSVLQYSFENFVYNVNTGAFIRIADASEQNAEGRHMVLLDITVDGTVFSFRLKLGDYEFDLESIEGNAKFCIVPPIGKFNATYSYITASGNRFEHSQDITVLPANTRQVIYELAEPTKGDTDASILEPYNITAFTLRWMNVCDFCNGRPGNLAFIHPYQKFYIPIDASNVRINNGIACTEYALALDAKLPGLTISIERATLFGEQAAKTYFVLMSSDYAGKYDITVEYKLDNEWNIADQLTKILSTTVNPLWTVNTIRQAALNADTVKLTIDDIAANNGGYMPASYDATFAKLVAKGLENVAINTGSHNEFLSLSVASIDDRSKLVVSSAGRNVEIDDVRRLPSFSLQTALTCKDSVPYVAFRPDCWLELHSGDNIVAQSYGMLVFAKTTANKYKLHVYNDVFDKTIEL